MSTSPKQKMTTQKMNMCLSSCHCAPRWGRRSGLCEVESRVSSCGPLWLGAVLALFAGALLRVWMLHNYPQNFDGDVHVYGMLAKNLLLHGQFALTDESGMVHATLIRLPGYPLLLALIFRLFGMENYSAVIALQIVLDLLSCLLLADFVRRLTASSAAALFTLCLAALCPFTAIYSLAPLTETCTIFSIALALWTGVRFLHRPQGGAAWIDALLFGAALSAAAMLRPDGALVAVALAPALLIGSLQAVEHTRKARMALLRLATVCVLLAMIPFAAWTLRNWKTFHVIEPIAPRYATDPGENPFPGWQRWVKTWCLDFISTAQIYWNVPDGTIGLQQLPSRAFDSPQQQAETAALIDEYNQTNEMTPELDARFFHLAHERTATHPLRSYLWLPLGRMTDMWLRPRVENLPIDLDWWSSAHHRSETRFCWAYAALNLLYLLLAAVGLCLKPRLWRAMLAYFILRSLLLASIEAPETRYTLECFPMIFALGGIALDGGYRRIRGCKRINKSLIASEPSAPERPT